MTAAPATNARPRPSMTPTAIPAAAATTASPPSRPAAPTRAISAPACMSAAPATACPIISTMAAGPARPPAAPSTVATGSSATCTNHSSSNCSCSGTRQQQDLHHQEMGPYLGRQRPQHLDRLHHGPPAQRCDHARCVQRRDPGLRHLQHHAQSSVSDSKFPAENNLYCLSATVTPLGYNWTTLTSQIDAMNANGVHQPGDRPGAWLADPDARLALWRAHRAGQHHPLHHPAVGRPEHPGPLVRRWLAPKAPPRTAISTPA